MTIHVEWIFNPYLSLILYCFFPFFFMLETVGCSSCLMRAVWSWFSAKHEYSCQSSPASLKYSIWPFWSGTRIVKPFLLTLVPGTYQNSLCCVCFLTNMGIFIKAIWPLLVRPGTIKPSLLSCLLLVALFGCWACLLVASRLYIVTNETAIIWEANVIVE